METVNTNTGRVVALAYYYSWRQVTSQLEMDED